MRANADLDSLAPRLAEVIDDHLAPLFGVVTSPASPAPTDAADAPALLRPDRPVPGAEMPPTADRRWDLLEECRLDPDRPTSPGYERLSVRKISRTDPDATPMSMRDGRAALGYQDHYVVDGGRARIILHALVTPADVMENQPLLDQVRRTIFRHHLRPERVIADTAYGTIENIRALEADGIQAVMPLPEWGKHSAYFPSSRFVYDAARDVYRCPQGEELRVTRRETAAEKTEYSAAAATCNACPLKAQCTASDRGRQIHRSFHAEYLERVHGYHATAAFRKAMRTRSVWVEPLFAEAKQWHGLRQFRLRGLDKVNMEGLLVATGQNLKRLLAALGWGRRLGPCTSLMMTCSVVQPVRSTP